MSCGFRVIFALLPVGVLSTCIPSSLEALTAMSRDSYMQLSIYARLALPSDTGACTLEDMTANFKSLWNLSNCSVPDNSNILRCYDLVEAYFLAKNYETRISEFIRSPLDEKQEYRPYMGELVTLHEALLYEKFGKMPIQLERAFQVIAHLQSMPSSPDWLRDLKGAAEYHWKKLETRARFLNRTLRKSVELLENEGALDTLDEHYEHRCFLEGQLHYSRPVDSLVRVAYKIEDVRETAKLLCDNVSPFEQDKKGIIEKKLDLLERQDIFIFESIADLSQTEVSQLANIIKNYDLINSRVFRIPLHRKQDAAVDVDTPKEGLFIERLRFLAENHKNYSNLGSTHDLSIGNRILRAILKKLMMNPIRYLT